MSNSKGYDGYIESCKSNYVKSKHLLDEINTLAEKGISTVCYLLVRTGQFMFNFKMNLQTCHIRGTE